MSDSKFAGYLNPELMGVPCGSDRIAEIEQNLKRELPQSFRDFVMETGGGAVNPERYYIAGDFLPSEPGGVGVFYIYGNGNLSNGRQNDIDSGAAAGPICIQKEWEYPLGTVLFALSSAGAHVVYLINYDLPEFPVHSILVANSEGEIGLLAADFLAFLEMLQEPDF